MLKNQESNPGIRSARQAFIDHATWMDDFGSMVYWYKNYANPSWHRNEWTAYFSFLMYCRPVVYLLKYWTPDFYKTLTMNESWNLKYLIHYQTKKKWCNQKEWLEVNDYICWQTMKWLQYGIKETHQNSVHHTSSRCNAVRNAVKQLLGPLLRQVRPEFLQLFLQILYVGTETLFPSMSSWTCSMMDRSGDLAD